MDVKLFLCAWAFLSLGGFAAAQRPGTDFALVFMQNVLPSEGKPRLELLLTSFFPNTTVNICMPRRCFKKEVSLETGILRSVALPNKVNPLSSLRSNMTVHVSSNRPISVVAINKQANFTGAAVLSPIADWGTEYYIMTPDSEPGYSFGEVAIVNGPQKNRISILLSVVVQIGQVNYLPGSKLNLTLHPWESVHLQTNKSMTGSRLVSQQRVAVFSGLGCFGSDSLCNPVYTQLHATASWGYNFVLPPLPLSSPGKVTIVSASNAQVGLVSGNDTRDVMVAPGMKTEFEINPTRPLSIESSQKIMVLLYFGASSGILYNVPSIDATCVAYSMVSLPQFENHFFLVADQDDLEFTLDGKPLPAVQWESLDSTGLVYGSHPLSHDKGYSFIYNAGAYFGLGILAMGKSVLHLLPAVCLDKEYLLCQFTCANDLCNILGNTSNCVSLEKPTCMAWGKSNLLTFYETHMYGSPYCPQVLIYSNGDDLSLLPFSVERHAGSGATVLVRVFDQLLDFSTKQSGVVTVNNENLHTPISVLDGKLNITRFGLAATMIKVSFGLSVVIGDNGFLHLEIDERYFEGLSGDCVARPSKGKFRLRRPISQGLSIACEPTMVEVLKQCSNESVSVDLSCQLMLKSDIFQSCHMTLDPRPFIESCQSEVCNGGSSCVAIESYAMACAINGVRLTGWRNITQCSLQCPLHSHHESCSSTCQASCSESQIFNCDPDLCLDTCLCDVGYELSGGSCVPKDKCGCHWQGSYYPNDKEFIGKNCKTMCRCSGSKMECQQMQGCPKGNTCELRNGLWSCQPKNRMSCTLYGDSHCITFDGKAYHFNGTCESRLAGFCDNSSGQDAFDVHIVKDPKWGTSVQAVKIIVYGKSIIFSPNYNGEVNVDGTLVYTPYVLGTSLQVYTSNHGAMILQTDFGLVVSFDQLRRLQIKLPNSYKGFVCGLCTSVTDRVLNRPLCHNYCRGVCNQCLNESHLPKTTTDCGLFIDPEGFFRDCHEKVAPDQYLEACVNDLCSGESFCPTLHAYAAACREIGAKVYPWRQEVACGNECPPNSTFTTAGSCGSSSPSSCGMMLPIMCDVECQDGCQCSPGYVLSGDTCVLPEDCGCYQNGQYWKRGDFFYDDDCQNLCSCTDGEIICEEHRCNSDETCAVVLGVRACYPLTSTCLVSGLTYQTFDGFRFPFSKDCLFLMASITTTRKVVNFEIFLRRKVSSDGDLATFQEAVVKMYGYEIVLNILTEGPEVNGKLTNFPVELSNRVKIYKDSLKIVLKTDFNLFLKFNSSMVSLEVPLDYAERVVGLCGKKMVLSGESLSDLPIDNHMSFWSSYVEQTSCDEEFNVTTPYNITRFCELIMEVEGPFQECHNFLDPQGFYNSCLSITNVNQDDMHSVCQKLQLYDLECQMIGATVESWRNETFCKPRGPLHETVFNLTTTSPSTSGPPVECLPRSVPLACSSLDKTSCLFQARHFPWGDEEALQSIECSWSLAKVCNNDTALDFFSVWVQYEAFWNDSTESLHVEVYGLNISLPLNWEKGVWVNNVPVTVPACLVPGKLQISVEDSSLILDTHFGLLIKYHQNGFINIQLPLGFQNMICGQCAQEPHETRLVFIAQVSKDNSESQCSNITMEPWDGYEDNSTRPNYCSMLLGDESPFRDCHSIINPISFFDKCEFNVCQELQVGGIGDEAACRYLEEYATLCQLQYVTIKPWRNESFCSFTCPTYGTYELCTRTCLQCQNGNCLGPCQEGCNCTEGYLWNGLECVTSDMCTESMSQASPKYLNCDPEPSSQSICSSCNLSNHTISTFGNVSVPVKGNGVYDMTLKCDSSAPQWLRVVLRVQQSNSSKLHIFYERNFVTINSTLEVWVNGQLEVLPITLEPELYVTRTADTVVLGQPGTMRIAFSSAGDLEILVAESLATGLCGVCAFGKQIANQSPIYSIDFWLAEDLSWMNRSLIFLLLLIMPISLVKANHQSEEANDWKIDASGNADEEPEGSGSGLQFTSSGALALEVYVAGYMVLAVYTLTTFCS